MNSKTSNQKQNSVMPHATVEISYGQLAKTLADYIKANGDDQTALLISDAIDMTTNDKGDRNFRHIDIGKQLNEIGNSR